MFFIEYVWFSDGSVVVKKFLEKFLEFLIRVKEMFGYKENNFDDEVIGEVLLDSFLVLL